MTEETIERYACIAGGASNYILPIAIEISDHDHKRWNRIYTYISEVLHLNTYGHSEDQRYAIGKKGVNILRSILSKYGQTPTEDELYSAGAADNDIVRVFEEDPSQGLELLVERMTELAATVGVPDDEQRQMGETTVRMALDIAQEQLALAEMMKNKN